jgi:hypothetical protein
VGGTRRIGVGGAQFFDGREITVNGTKMTVNGTAITVEADAIDVGAGAIHLHSKTTIVLESAEIRLVAGASTLTMTSSEIRLDSPLINLNP